MYWKITSDKGKSIQLTDKWVIKVADEVRSHFEGLVFETVIHRNVKLSEAPSHGENIIAYDAGSKGAENYLTLAQELIAKAS